MKFEEKISGTKVTDFEINSLFSSQFISLQEVMEKLFGTKLLTRHRLEYQVEMEMKLFKMHIM